jgi:hypothetical protein
MTGTSNAVIFIGLMWTVSATHAAPRPPEKPPEFRGRSRNSAAPQTLPAISATSPPGAVKLMASPVVDACIVGLGAMGVKAQGVSAPPSGSDACGVATPIRIEQVTDLYGRGNPVLFTNKPLIDCKLAEPLAHWLGEVVAPVIAANFSSTLKAIQTGPGYECRNRNHEAKGKLSAHAIGMALDISGFELSDGRILSFGAGSDLVTEGVLRTIRTAGCGWFTTILGPGSDASHTNHLHVDIQMHGPSGHYRICE